MPFSFARTGSLKAMQHLFLLIAFALTLDASPNVAQPSSVEARAATSTMAVAYPTTADSSEGSLRIDEAGSVVLNIIVKPGSGFLQQAIVKEADLAAFQAILEKMLKWQDIAVQNKVEPFEKPIGVHDNRPVIFVYTGPENPALIRQRTSNFLISANEAPTYLRLLTLYPETRTALDQKLAKAKKENELFQ